MHVSVFLLELKQMKPKPKAVREALRAMMEAVISVDHAADSDIYTDAPESQEAVKRLRDAIGQMQGAMKLASAAMPEFFETITVFRVWKDTGDVIALFPEIDEGHGNCSSYMHVGQHSAASFSQVVSRTRPASTFEYAPLKRELEASPYSYKLRIVRKWGRK
jgi:hypothetical protein